MTTRDDLMAAIIANPRDDGLRLVMADWLDEHGDSRRAEFIRLQIRIAEIERFCSCGSCVKLRGGGQCTNGPCAVSRERDEQPDGTSRNAMLRLKESNLLDFGFDEIPKYTKITYCRGFPAEVTLTMAQFLDGERCGQCGGSKVVPRPNRKRRDAPAIDCPDCHGSGRTPGVIDRLVAWPIEKVTISDAVIHASGGNDTYYVGNLGLFPNVYWQGLEGHRTRSSALAALSYAAVRLIGDRRKQLKESFS